MSVLEWGGGGEGMVVTRRWTCILQRKGNKTHSGLMLLKLRKSLTGWAWLIR